MNESRLKICVFGLGEAGGLISADLAAGGASVNGYDPRSVPTPQGVRRFDEPIAAVENADIVVALTAAADAPEALEQAFDAIPDSALYADFSTSGSELKQDLAARCAAREIDFADVAIMAIVPGNGVKAPTLVSGSGAGRFVDRFTQFGMPTSVVSTTAGDAAARKLVRSVMMKGLAAIVIESKEAADAADCSEWLWRNITDEITAADENFLARLVRGTHAHGKRRLHEMEASTSMLEGLGVEPIMTASTTRNLRKLLRDWPSPEQEPGQDGKAMPKWWNRF